MEASWEVSDSSQAPIASSSRIIGVCLLLLRGHRRSLHRTVSRCCIGICSLLGIEGCLTRLVGLLLLVYWSLLRVPRVHAVLNTIFRIVLKLTPL